MYPRILIACLFLAVTLPPLGASQEDAKVRAVISAQLDAIRNDDADAAFAIASPEIQQKFRDPATFLAMVARAYPQVYRPKSVDFLDLVAGGGRLVQRVLITGPDGRLVLALYDMLQIDGAWRINGCALAIAPEKET